jgi:hypothetical protein
LLRLAAAVGEEGLCFYKYGGVKKGGLNDLGKLRQ